MSARTLPIKRWLVVLSPPGEELDIADTYATRGEAARHVQDIRKWHPAARVVDAHACTARLSEAPIDETTGRWVAAATREGE